MTASVNLTELEHDALTELVNIGVSRAASSLRSMVGEQVLLSVPSVDVVTRMAAATLIRERESEELVAVRQDFEGAFSGRAMLIFPQANSLELVKAVTGDDLDACEVRAMEMEALAETGNVVLNGCLATMANLLRRPLTMSLPEVVRGDGKLFFEIENPPEDDAVVLFLYINFTISGRDIRGYIAMLMDLPSLRALKELVGEFIASVMATDDLGELG
ncbi:chemotaxis protein CheX [Phenylobacterium sp. Root77]|jgi:chemotaxis protein CheC|uniref:chemotaxis protein CheX n=1 Tax=unclassified Phenylobacterium TaxID=2640670 RepID=UPI0006F26947|nr:MULTISPECIES: chemotaxis protein CheX [unclassified Phenylobacterium]KQW66960.1 chemotaxis protein CheX [Phenylobacterium sp. Root1277]KQW89653.1 chemotaxis protein CheX [Phenylobacterium sp. Root1290]KRC43478.1 chemotaxis protein CheX [Phenylobacterium sp. Root77]